MEISPEDVSGADEIKFPDIEGTFKRNGKPQDAGKGFVNYDFSGPSGGAEADLTVNVEDGEVIGRIASGDGKVYLIK